MELFDFGAFQNFMQMLSHDKIIFHMLFGAFHVTSRKYQLGDELAQLIWLYKTDWLYFLFD